MEVGTVLKLLDIMSRALPVLLALSGIIAFVFREWIKKWIEAHFRKTVDSELELLRSQLSESLESKKATLAKELAIQTETLKAQLTSSLEREKRALDEEFRRKAKLFDQRSAFYEAFSTGYGAVIVELHALNGDYYNVLKEYPDLLAQLRKTYLARAHSMLMQADQNLKPHDPYVDSQMNKRIAKLFSDLSRFMADDARDKIRLDELASEMSLIEVTLRDELLSDRP
jgi:hypothetical protein